MTALLEQQLQHDFEWSRKELYKKALGNWIEELSCDYFVTFTFRNPEISKESAEKALKLFIMRINRSLFGNRPKRKLIMIPFIEKNYFQGYHFHIFMKIPEGFYDNTIKVEMKKQWCLLAESGKSTFEANLDGNHKWFTPINDSEGLSKYVLKQSNNCKIDNLVSDLISK